METKFDYISEYKVLSEGYCDPPIWATYGANDDPDYLVRRGYEIKDNGTLFRVWSWVFITKKLWKIEQYDPNCEYNNKWTYKGDCETLALALDKVKKLAE